MLACACDSSDLRVWDFRGPGSPLLLVHVLIVICGTNGANLSMARVLRTAMRLLSGALQKGNGEIHRRSGLVLSRELGIRYDPGLGVPVVPDWILRSLWLGFRILCVTRLQLRGSEFWRGKFRAVMCR